MSIAIWSAWADEWALNEKVSFNGINKLISVNSGVLSIDIREDIYSAWIRWQTRETNSRYLSAMRYSGLDALPGGGSTGGTFFLLNGWKVIYDPTYVAVSGVLYSEDYDTAFWNADGLPIYPATVSSLVNTSVTTQNVVTGDISSLSIPTSNDNAVAVRAILPEINNIDTAVSSRATTAAIWAHLVEELSAEEILRIALAALAGKTAGIGSTSETYLAQDGVTSRINATFDSNNNRTTVVLNGTA